MTREELESRCEDFTVQVGRMALALPRNRAAQVDANQGLRAAGSIEANDVESAHGSSARHFIRILEVAQREARERLDWLRVIAKSGRIKPERLGGLIREADELLSIMTRSIVTAKRHRKA